MSVFPVILDPSPDYLGHGSTERSLLLTPVGSGTLLCRLHARFAALGSFRLTVAPAFRPDAVYRAALHAACSEIERVVSPGEFRELLATLEPSDWLLILDPTCVPAESINPDLLLRASAESPRAAVHLIALETNVGGTCEWVDVNDLGDVTRIQRYYDEVTWSYTSGVAASLVPVSCLLTSRDLRIDSLRALRTSLATTGVPARDVPLTGRTFDLTDERELMMFTDRVMREGGAPGQSRFVAASATVDKSARLLGPVIVQRDAHIGEDTLVVGPTVIGRGARIGAGAVVVQCVVSSGAIIAPQSISRHKLVSNGTADREQRQPKPAYDPFAVRPFGSDLQDHPTPFSWYPLLKVVAESTIAWLALIVLLPLLAVVAALIKLESRGPVFFADRREAKGGRNFRCLKFRTMLQGADAMQRELLARNEVDGPQFKLDKDPRVTRVGRWIRPCSIDELPQLVNVALGQMSLVGPRPSPFRENQTCVPWREGRLSVRPGITGLWQVCRHDRGEGDFHQWIHYDLLYVEHMSFAVDVKIVLATILTLGGKWCVPLSWIIPSARLRPAIA